MTFQKTWLDLGSEGVEEPRRLDVPWMSLWKVLGSRNGVGGAGECPQAPGSFSLSLTLP